METSKLSVLLFLLAFSRILAQLADGTKYDEVGSGFIEDNEAVTENNVPELNDNEIPNLGEVPYEGEAPNEGELPYEGEAPNEGEAPIEREESEGSLEDKDPCTYEYFNVLPLILVLHVRQLVPDTVSLSDQREGRFKFHSFTVEGISQFVRSGEAIVACTEEGIMMNIPLRWEKPLIGHFQFKFSRLNTQIDIILEDLEAEAVLEVPFNESPLYVAHVKSVQFIRSQSPRVLTRNFGYLGNFADKLGTWLAKMFQTRIRRFLSKEFKKILDDRMIQIVIGSKESTKH